MKNLRQCIVNDQLCYFHGWNIKYDIIEPSPMIGGHPGGQISATYGIIEFPDGKVNEFIRPGAIRFCDDIHRDLYCMDDYHQAHKKEEETKDE